MVSGLMLMAQGAFSVSAQERVAALLAEKQPGRTPLLWPLTPDASTREYFRVVWEGQPAVVAAYAEPFDPATQTFLDVTGLFRAAQLPVPEIYHVAGEQGLIVQEDCGDCQLYNFYRQAPEDTREQYKEEAIALIARLQAATGLAEERGSCAAFLAFDEAKLGWELTFFYEHFFGSLRREQLSVSEEEKIKEELGEVARELAERPRVLCHRDFHAGNLLVDGAGRLRVIDYQDARMGPASYDLVSLLLDRVEEPPALSEIRAGRLLFLEERERVGLPSLGAEEFTQEFWLMTVQRVLKAIGTFSFQTAARGRGAAYGCYIQPMLLVAAQAAAWLGRFPVLRKALRERAAQNYAEAG